jgi:hypothetical protein
VTERHGRIKEMEKAKDRNKSWVRAKADDVFGVITNVSASAKSATAVWRRTCAGWR